MKCELCGSETPPHYQQHNLAAIICHTCKSLGRFVEGLVVESKPPAPVIEQTMKTEPAQETVQEAKDDENTESPSPVPAQDATASETVPPIAQDSTPATSPNKKKTTKL